MAFMTPLAAPKWEKQDKSGECMYVSMNEELSVSPKLLIEQVVLLTLDRVGNQFVQLVAHTARKRVLFSSL